jgi:hypothetical protein
MGASDSCPLSSIHRRFPFSLRLEFNDRKHLTWSADDRLASLCRTENECLPSSEGDEGGIEAKKGADGLVSREEVERAARELMEGDGGMKIKKRMEN